MLLKSLKLKDFRQFRGEQSISFSTDSEKNVTVIMGQNGSGKTTLAQAFTWCLYGNTDFDDKSMLCKATAQDMLPNAETNVRVELALVHNNKEYLCIREQRYSKDSNGKLRKPNQTVFKIAYKNSDGQREYVKDLQTDMTMNEILPKKLSRYFFFDGERIGNMSKEIRKGKSNEFAQAVKSLLGLNALQSTLNHLDSRTTRTSVIRSYNQSYNSTNDRDIATYTKQIEECEEKIELNNKRLEEILVDENIATEKIQQLEDEIRANSESETLAKQRDDILNKINKLKETKSYTQTLLLKRFGKNAQGYFAKQLMNDAVNELAKEDKIDKGIPHIHADTIEYLIKRKKCICGADIEFGNSAYKQLNDLLPYILPNYIGAAIGKFVTKCEATCQYSDGLFDDVKEYYKRIRDCECTYSDYNQQIETINSRLENLKNVGELQVSLSKYKKDLINLESEKTNINRNIGSLETTKHRNETLRNNHTLKDKNNRKIEIYKAYAQYMYDSLNKLYIDEETKIRTELEKTVNEIFRSIYNGGFSLSIDEKYSIQVVVNDYQGFNEDIETSTAQSISVIFAFIAGVIQMARNSEKSENELLVSEAYPLVMDAPLSAFDKKRIQTVCEALPKVAEQVIIFIKDTDGELAEKYLEQKVGSKYEFSKKNEFETDLKKR